jgi:hypothetical protein
MNTPTKPGCRRLALRALEEQGRGNSSFGEAKIAADKGIESIELSLRTKANDHHESAYRFWQEAKKEAQEATQEDCASCLGRLGVDLCPLISEVEVPISDLYDKLGEKRGRVAKALKGEAVKKSKKDFKIAQVIGTAVSNINELDYSDYGASRCALGRIGRELLDPIVGEVERGVDPEVLLELSIGSETPSDLSAGRLTSNEPIAFYLLD